MDDKNPIYVTCHSSFLLFALMLLGKKNTSYRYCIKMANKLINRLTKLKFWPILPDSALPSQLKLKTKTSEIYKM